MSPLELASWAQQFDVVPEPLADSEKAEFLAGLTGVSLASDAFFPFRDSLDVGARYGVSYITQPGGSNKVRAHASRMRPLPASYVLTSFVAPNRH